MPNEDDSTTGRLPVVVNHFHTEHPDVSEEGEAAVIGQRKVTASDENHHAHEEE